MYFTCLKNKKSSACICSSFCSFPGGRRALKYSKIVVGSLKIDGSTFSKKNKNVSKIRPKINLTRDPRNHKISKKATRSTQKKTPRKQEEKIASIVQKYCSKRGTFSHVKSLILDPGVASTSNVPQSEEKAPKVSPSDPKTAPEAPSFMEKYPPSLRKQYT